jgi:hypothetical protein
MSYAQFPQQAVLPPAGVNPSAPFWVAHTAARTKLGYFDFALDRLRQQTAELQQGCPDEGRLYQLRSEVGTGVRYSFDTLAAVILDINEVMRLVRLWDQPPTPPDLSQQSEAFRELGSTIVVIANKLKEWTTSTVTAFMVPCTFKYFVADVGIPPDELLRLISSDPQTFQQEILRRVPGRDEEMTRIYQGLAGAHAEFLQIRAFTLQVDRAFLQVAEAFQLNNQSQGTTTASVAPVTVAAGAKPLTCGQRFKYRLIGFFIGLILIVILAVIFG